MATHKTSLLINATPGAVWKILSDLESWPKWTPTVSSLTLLTAGPPTIGARARVLQPKLRPAVWEVSHWEPGVGFTWTSSGFGLRVVAGHYLAPVEQSCQLSLTIEFHGIVGKIASMVSSKLTDEYLNLEANGLKRYVESGQSP